jgi:hypothetical protein
MFLAHLLIVANIQHLQGHSSGPLIYQMSTGRSAVVGVVSFLLVRNIFKLFALFMVIYFIFRSHFNFFSNHFCFVL